MPEGTRPTRTDDSPESVAALHAKVDAIVDTVKEIKTDDLLELKDTAKEIKAAQLVTNGRVTQLELWRARWDGTRWAFSWLPPLLTGTLAGIAVVVVSKLVE